MLKVYKIYKSYGTREIISDASFSLERGQKIAIVGPNGVGKTTLLKIIAGIEKPDSGFIGFSKNIRVGYLPQDMNMPRDKTISEYLSKVAGSQIFYDDNKHKTEIVLAGFGFDALDVKSRLSDLSSGQKNKISLAGILLKGVDLLLLDEPTNNLDLPALIWLESFVKESGAAALIVSHDRKFLDSVASKVMEIDRDSRKLKIESGSYSDYIHRRARERARLKEQYLFQEEKISHLSGEVEDKKERALKGARWQASDNNKLFRGFKRDRASKSAKRAKAIEKRIERMDKIDKPPEHISLNIPLEASSEWGVFDVELYDIVAGYSPGFKIGPISLSISLGSRVGIIGLNGSGKSTLLKVFANHLKPFSGSVKIGSGVIFGDLMQEHETLPRDETILELFLSKTDLRTEDVFSLLVKFGFSARQLKEKVETLSPGGRTRLLLALFSVKKANILVLDEPTNHLDIEALDALEEVLKSYKGSIILVSHDRYFLEKTKLDSVYLLSGGVLKKLLDYRDYVHSAEQNARKLNRML